MNGMMMEMEMNDGRLLLVVMYPEQQHVGNFFVARVAEHTIIPYGICRALSGAHDRSIKILSHFSASYRINNPKMLLLVVA